MKDLARRSAAVIVPERIIGIECSGRIEAERNGRVEGRKNESKATVGWWMASESNYSWYGTPHGSQNRLQRPPALTLGQGDGLHFADFLRKRFQ